MNKLPIETMQHRVAFDIANSLAAKRDIEQRTDEFDNLYLDTLANVRKYNNETLADVYSFIFGE